MYKKYRVYLINPVTGEYETIYLRAKSEFHAVKLVERKYLIAIVLNIYLVNKKRSIEKLI